MKLKTMDLLNTPSEKYDAMLGIIKRFLAFGLISVSFVTILPLYAMAAAISQGSAISLVRNQSSFAELIIESSEYAYSNTFE